MIIAKCEGAFIITRLDDDVGCAFNCSLETTLIGM